MVGGVGHVGVAGGSSRTERIAGVCGAHSQVSEKQRSLGSITSTEKKIAQLAGNIRRHILDTTS